MRAHWQQVNILVEVLNRREGETKRRGRGEGRKKGEGCRGEQVVQSVESYISCPWLRGRIRFIQRLLLALFFFCLKEMNYASSGE